MQKVDLSKFYRIRPRESRKGDYGRVVIAGGSNTYAGCLALNALGALRSGADIAVVVAPRRAADIVGGYSPDLITVPCDSSFPDPKVVNQHLENANALVLGCGVERTPKAHSALISIIAQSEIPVVADAEALHAIKEKPSVTRRKRVLLTPNAKEFQVLSGQSWPNSPRTRTDSIKALAKRYASTVIVKGMLDYVSDGDQVYVDRNGSPYMTKGGYGDLLAGVAGAMLARGCSPFEAARVAAFLVGRAGERAAFLFGESTLASDALAQISPSLPRKGK